MNIRTAILACVSAALVAGCQNSSLSPRLQSSDSKAYPIIDDGRPPYLAGVTEFHWATSNTYEEVAIRFALRFHKSQTVCQRTIAASGEYEPEGYAALVIGSLFGSEPINSESTYDGDDIISVTRGDISYRVPVASGGDRKYRLFSDDSIIYTNIPELPFLSEITIIARGLKAVEGSFSDGYSAAISISCDSPFDVVGGYLGDQVGIYDVRRSPGDSVQVLNTIDLGATSGSLTTDDFRFEVAMFTSPMIDGTISYTCGESASSYSGNTAGRPLMIRTIAISGISACSFKARRIADPLAINQDESWFAIFSAINPLSIDEGLLAESAISN